MTNGDDEQEWVSTMLRQNEALERARRIQPGRGHPYRYEQDSDWWVLAIIGIFLIAGILA